jgi:uncharacterized protein YbjT (DUF2867 family)
VAAPSFVVGATGFVGRHLVGQLAARGRRTIAHVRPDSPQLERWRTRFAEQGAETDTTPWQVEAMAARLRELRPEAIYLCIGTTQKRAKADAAGGNPYERVDYGLTKLIVDAARQASGAASASAGGAASREGAPRPRLVYLSSIGASAVARSEYLAWRGKAEDAVRDSGLPWMIAQPSFIIEASGAPDGARDDRRPAERAAAVVGDCALAALGLFGARKLRSRYRSTTPDVLAAALIRLAEAPEAGRVVSGDELR